MPGDHIDLQLLFIIVELKHKLIMQQKQLLFTALKMERIPFMSSLSLHR